MEAGGIDWDAVWRGDTSGVSEYACPALEVVTFPGAGRGLRAATALAAGTLLLAERAVASAPEPELAARLVGMLGDLEDTTRCRLEFMCDGSPPPAVEAPISLPAWPGVGGGGAAGEIPLARMERIVDLNAYRCHAPISEYAFTPDDEPSLSDAERHQAYGVFPLGALVNHSCAPNVSKVLLNGWVFLRAARDIPAGEEVTQFYCDVRMPLEMRQKELLELFGFTCICPRCLFEREVEAAGGDVLAPYRSLYSCQVPGFNASLGPVQVSQLEGVIAEAEQAVFAALRRDTAAKLSRPESELKQWALWPLVPARSQLAERLALDGRLSESSAAWRKACHAAEAVVPLSNVHLRLLAERLLAEVQRSRGSARAKDALAESQRATQLAYGGGLPVWRRLVGFRLPASFLEDLPPVNGTAADSHPEEGRQQGVDAGLAASDGGHPQFSWQPLQLDAASGRHSASLAVPLPEGARLEDVSLDASARLLIVRCPGMEDVQISCPIDLDLELLRTRFSKRTCSLQVSCVERAQQRS